VQISKQGEIFIASVATTDAALPRTLRDLASRNKDPALVIQADKSAPYARVVFVLDHAKQAGITRISLATAPP
jgi:biopolymer transport protein ExbD